MSDIDLIKNIREKTGLPLGQIKKAIEAIGQDEEKVITYLREQGVLKSEARADRATNHGGVFTYVHEGRLGVMLMIKCETDFVARSESFQVLGQDLALHIAAYQPRFVSPLDVDENYVEKELDITRKQMEQEGKTAEIIEKILLGKRKKVQEEVSLLSQSFLKNPDITVADHFNQIAQSTGEKLVITKFVIYNINL